MNRDLMPSEQTRAWMSVLLSVHFFIIAICLIQNNGSSFLMRRIQQLTAPYSVALHQDLGARSLEWTSETGLARAHLVQFRTQQTDSPWVTVQPHGSSWLNVIDERWENFEHMLAVAVSENDEALVYQVFETVVEHLRSKSESEDVNTIRLVRPATLSFRQETQYRAGQLPVKDLEEEVLFEARVIRVSDSIIRLIPVLEPTRRATSMEPAR